MEFHIDAAYIKDVLVTEYYPAFTKEKLTGNDFFKAIKNSEKCYVAYSHKDHPEFTKLRDQLEHLGYIKTQRSWSNGDRVIKPFSLNGEMFHIGDKFLSAAAMQVRLKVAGKLSNDY